MTQAIEKPADLSFDLPAGIHPGIPFSDYQQIKAMNASTLQWGRKSMAHLKAAMDGRLQRKDTDSLRFGRALHTRLLEPDVFKDRHPIIPDFGDMRSSTRRAERDEWLAQFPANIDPIKEIEARQIEACVKAVANHPAENLRKCRGIFEVAIVGELLGVRCKARLDKLIASPLTIMDVKKVAAPASPSAPSGDPESFEKRIDNYGYGMQAAMYCDLVAQFNQGKTPAWYWLVVEDDEPWSVGVYRADASLIAAGRNEYSSLLARMKACEANDKWPSFSADVVTLYGPDWWRKQNGGS